MLTKPWHVPPQQSQLYTCDPGVQQKEMVLSSGAAGRLLTSYKDDEEDEDDMEELRRKILTWLWDGERTTLRRWIDQRNETKSRTLLKAQETLWMLLGVFWVIKFK